MLTVMPLSTILGYTHKVGSVPAHPSRPARTTLSTAGCGPLSAFTALGCWCQRAFQGKTSIGTVGNTISGGIQQGPVLQGRDFSNITFGTSPPSPGARR